MTVTFIPHGSDVAKPFFDSSNSMWRVFMPPAGYFGYGGHGALQSTTGFGHHDIMTKMEIQCLDNVGGVIIGAWMQRTQMINDSHCIIPHL